MSLQPVVAVAAARRSLPRVTSSYGPGEEVQQAVVEEEHHDREHDEHDGAHDRRACAAR